MKWIIRISNSHGEVARKEIEALLPRQSLNWLMPVLALVEAEEEDIERLLKTSATLKWILTDPIIHQAQRFGKIVEKLDLRNQHPPTSCHSFAVRFEQIMIKNQNLSKTEIERKIGAKLVSKFGLEVDLTTPDNVYKVIYFDHTFVLGWIYEELEFERIASRSPKESPFFGGGAMKPMLSRILVNLLYPHDTIVVDPFCGHGGILREISHIQSYAIGIEISPKIAREAHVNNKFHKVEQTQIIMGDALALPFRRAGINQIVSDPPYAKQSTTIGRDREDLIDNWLQQCSYEKVIMSLPVDMNIKIPEKYNMSLYIEDYVHRSLTRAIRKLELLE